MSTEDGVIGFGCLVFHRLSNDLDDPRRCHFGALLPLTEVHQLPDVYRNPA
jgi:hypothetical protein